MIAAEVSLCASELSNPVSWAKTNSWPSARFATLRAGAAAVGLACTAAVASVTSASPVPAPWSPSITLAAALGAAFAIRRPRASGLPRRDDDGALLAVAGDFVVHHRIDGRVTAIEGEGLAGLALEEIDLTGYGLVDRVHDEDRSRFFAQLAAVAADGKTRDVVVRLRRSDGYQLVEAVSAQTAGGAMISGFRASRSLQDYSAELQTAREETRLERSLKDRLLANMSHELRTPLNAILGFSEILGDPALAPTDPDKRIEYARIIHTSADHLLSVVNLVLDMSRIEAGKFAVSPEPLELEPLIRECCDMLRLRAEAGKVEIVASSLPGGLEICADKGACRQILVNLLSNAVKFTPAHGRVVVEARVEAGAARISVADTGIGIKPDDLPRLGDPFFQVKSGYDRSYEGAGLGLSLVRGLVGLHDGSLVLESAFGVGTRVTVILPLVSLPSARRVAPARLETIPRLTLTTAAPMALEERRIA